MSLPAWLSLVAICLLGAISPGPSLAIVIRNTLNHSWRHGLVTAISHGAGVGLYALATALGLAAVLVTQAHIFEGLSLAGSAYLLWLGSQALRGVPNSRNRYCDEQSAHGRVSVSLTIAARDGVAIALLNPKIGLFFIALFSQFVTPNADASTTIILASTATLIDASWYALVATALSSAGIGAWLSQHQRAIDRISGALLVFLALFTAANVLAP